MDDLDMKAQQAAEAHLSACWEALAAEEAGEEIEWPEQLAGPFDGCDTCVVREVLSVAWPFLLEAARQDAKAEVS